MTLFQEQLPQPMRALSPTLVAHYRDVLVAHADDLALGACRHCRVPHCAEWRSAYDQLAAAGELMALPERWENATTSRGRR